MSKNRKRSLLIAVIGIVMIIVSILFPSKNQIIKDGNQIERNDFGKGERNVLLTAESSMGENIVEYTIRERTYTQTEVEEMLPEFIISLEKNVLGNNSSVDSVSSDLNFFEEIDGYPFGVTWHSDHSDLIGSRGNIKEEIQGKIPVILTANIEYKTLEYEHTFPIILVPTEYSAREQWIRDLKAAVVQADENSNSEKFLTLPQQVKGQAVSWKEERSNKVLQIGGFCMVIAIVFFFSDSVEAKEKEKKILKEIQNEYPEFVLKCSMLIGAGMTIRQAFERLAVNYQQTATESKALYEELIIGVRELGNGIPERLVYENFGKRCRTRETEKFGHILSRNLQKGSDGLKNALREEAQNAMEMHKETVKKQGETAGTKLLFPMLILLLIVMVIIMIPAFGTFNI